MAQKASLFSDAGHAFAFWGGSLAVTIGVLLHIPMFLMGRYTHYRLAGMPMDTGMLIGMGLIIAGTGATADSGSRNSASDDTAAGALAYGNRGLPACL